MVVSRGIVQAVEVLGDPSGEFISAAERAASVVWDRGLLKKGPGAHPSFVADCVDVHLDQIVEVESVDSFPHGVAGSAPGVLMNSSADDSFLPTRAGGSSLIASGRCHCIKSRHENWLVPEIRCHQKGLRGEQIVATANFWILSRSSAG